VIRVFDATPVIYLAKVDQLGLIADLDGRNLIPEAVYDEVVFAGMQEGMRTHAGSSERLRMASSRSFRSIATIHVSPPDWLGILG